MPILTNDQAFRLAVFFDKTALNAQWDIAENHYLYQSKLKITLLKPIHTSLTPDFPPAQRINDPYFGQQAVYSQSLLLSIPLENLNNTTLLRIDYQGCGQDLCYPPTSRWFAVSFDHIAAISPPESTTPIQKKAKPPSIPFSMITVLAFFLLGLLLSLTPCVLPMIPILLGLIVGQKQLSTSKAFWLSLSYVLSLSTTYALIGLSVATLGRNLQAYFQQPLIVSTFAGVFFYLGLTQLGIARFSSLTINLKPRGGTYLGAILMGALATLISSPCVSAPLIAALSYIAKSGNLLLGASALFATGLGMGTLLLALGTLGGKYLPKAGKWMQQVNQLFAMMLFGIGLWLLSRLLPGSVMLILWGLFCLLIAFCLNTFNRQDSIRSRLGVFFLLYALLLFWGAAQKQSHPLYLLTWQKASPLPFVSVTTTSALAKIKQQAKENKQPLLLVFHADWCTICQRLNKLWTDPDIKQHLAGWQFVKADITLYNQNSQQLLNQFNLIGPPAILFFDKNGQDKQRITGDIAKSAFLAQLQKMEGP